MTSSAPMAIQGREIGSGVETVIRLEEPSWFRAQWERRPDRAWLLLILVLALALRLVRLGTWSYWHDEVHNLVTGERFAEVLQGEFVSNHPPLFSFLVMLWQSVGLGENEWTMRMLVVLLGLAGIVTLFILARRLFGAPAALATAFLLAINPLHVFHSQDLKEYMILPVTAPVMAYFLYRAFDENRPYLWALYGLWAGIACYSELFVAPLLVALNLWVLWYMRRGNRDRLAGWALANVFGALLFVPQLAVMLRKVHQILIVAEDWWVRTPTPLSVAFYVKAVAFGYSDRQPYFKIALAVFVALVAVGMVLAWRRNRRAALMLAMWFIIPVALVYIGSQFVESFFLVRAMIPYALALHVLAGVALASVRPVPLRAVVLAALAALMGVSLVDRYQGRFPLTQWPHRPGIHTPLDSRGAARFVVDRWQEGDILVHASPFTWFSFYPYGFRDRPQQTVSTTQNYIDVIERGNPRNTSDPKFVTWFPRHLQPVVAEHERVWYVLADWHREYLGGNTAEVFFWLDAHYTELAHGRFRGLEVFLFGRRHEGDPVRTVARLDDDAAIARVRYRAGDRLLDYSKTQPDYGLVESPPEARRGRLTLRIDEAGARAVEAGARTVAFGVENRAHTDVSCRVVFIASDVLLEGTGLYETHPESDRWMVNRMYNTEPPPTQYETPVVTGRVVEEPGDPALVGEPSVPPGPYDTRLFLAGWPSPELPHIAPARIEVGGVDLLDVPRLPAGPGDWAWYAAPAVAVPESGILPIRVTARPREGVAETWFNLGYLALLRPRPETHGIAPGTVQPAWPGDVVVPAGATTEWRASVPADMGRVDVWVYERGEEGRAYRVFLDFAAGPM